MGRKNTKKPAPAKGPAVDTYEPGGGVAVEDSTRAPGFCEQEREITFIGTGREHPVLGAPVALALADPPVVLHMQQTVGFVGPVHALAMRACLEQGYAITGVITAVDDGNGGRARVRGQSPSP
jgi:hypothetical protein